MSLTPPISYNRSNISTKLDKKKSSLQFLPKCFWDIYVHKKIKHKDIEIKTAYLIDLIHTLILKYYFKRENKFILNAQVLKEKYGYLYKSYMDYLIDNGILKMTVNYKAGVNSRIYELNSQVFRGEMRRVKNEDKFLIKKYKKKVFETIDVVNQNQSSINQQVREKLISDLFSVDIDYIRSVSYLNSCKKSEYDVYNRNLYSVESIRDKHIFYHFDNYGRLHTNFTILKSFIRKNCLTIDGEETCEIDIKNSQPLFLCKLIKQSQTNWVNSEEFELFKNLTCTGNFYQYLMQSLQEKDRDKIKEFTYKVLFGYNSVNSKADKTFSLIFPTIHNFIKLYKREWKNHKVLAHDLQKAESNLIFNKIISKIMDLYPEIKIITIHDSIVYPKKFKKEVEEVFYSELASEFNFNDEEILIYNS